MLKRTQNKVAESRIALPVIATYGILIWLAAGLVTQMWWVQFLCITAAAYLMVELNNQNALIRIYSRMVSCSFLVLTCTTVFLFPSWQACVGTLFFAAFLLLLFRNYQDKQSPGSTFYAFCLFGLASLIFPHVLYFLPICWILMGSRLQMLSWRTLCGSFLGVLTPYWLLLPYVFWTNSMDRFYAHFEQLAQFETPFDFESWTVSHWLCYVLFIVLGFIGMVHYTRQRYQDKIRTRMLFDCFNVFLWTSAVWLAVQPQHVELLLPIMTISVSPLVAHFIALTHTRWTNIAFYVILAVTFTVTAINLWMSLSQL